MVVCGTSFFNIAQRKEREIEISFPNDDGTVRYLTIIGDEGKKIRIAFAHGDILDTQMTNIPEDHFRSIKK